MLTTLSRVLADPDHLGHTIRYVFAFVLLTIVFFAVLFSELGIVDQLAGGSGEPTRPEPHLPERRSV